MKLNDTYISQNIRKHYTHGRINVSIDFSEQIHNFKGHKSSGRVIYSCDEYQLYSRHEAMNKDSFFTARDITIYDIKTDEEVLLEDYAFSWITDSERNIRDFNSKNFLEQTCITHCIWRCREDNDSFAPYNDYLKEKHEKTSLVVNALIKMLEPKIKKTIHSFYNKYPQIDQLDIESQARQIVYVLLIGENKKHLETTRDFILKNNEKKLEARKKFRESSVHVLKHYKNKVNDGIDWQTVNDGTLEKILKTCSSLGDTELFLKMIEPDALAMIHAQTLNYNSNLIYKPWFDDSIDEHIFGRVGKKPLIFSILKDYFKAQINNKNNNLNLDNINESNISNDYLVGVPRRWKKNQNYFNESEKSYYLEKAKIVLTVKGLEVYKKWLSGNYNSSDIKERASLSRARKIIKETKIGIPI